VGHLLHFSWEESVHPSNPADQPKPPIQGISNILAVGSGKGGVGKTTVSVNLAISLAGLGYRVGLLDADVYGPNVPTMMGISEQPRGVEGRIQPLENYGVRFMSMGLLSPSDKPLVWRGPMLHSVMQQFLRQVDWGTLDYLIIDLPPGTGDVALSLIQTTPVTAALVVTTPSDVSLEDARKAIGMFRQVRVEILGIVENMSYLIAPQSKERIDVFGSGGGLKTAEAMGVPFLGELAMVPDIRKGGDSGRPVSMLGDSDERGKPFVDLARLVSERISQMEPVSAPKITIED
jgi:ATP-binding protein involved in chromosome partitioning